MHNKEQVFISYHIKIKTLPTKATLSITRTYKNSSPSSARTAETAKNSKKSKDLLVSIKPHLRKMKKSEKMKRRRNNKD